MKKLIQNLNGVKYNKVVLMVQLIAALFLGTAMNGFASEPQGHEAKTAEAAHGEASEEFQAGEFILEHVGDAHEWHVAAYHGTHYSIPLPIIVYSKHSGLHVFMSSKFHHGHESYEGLYLDKKTIREEGQTDIPLDLSITKNVAAMLSSVVILLLLFVSAGRAAKKNYGGAPKGLLAFLEPLVLFVKEDIAVPNIGEKHHERYLPYLITVFFFILVNNLMGIIPIPPGGANLTGNISVTMTLAVITLLLILISSKKYYWKHIFNTPGAPWWLKIPIPLIPFIELVGIFTKPFALMIRLFANITAGHIIILCLICLIFILKTIYISPLSIFLALFISTLELLVAALQAYIFTLLSALFIGLALEEEHQH